MENKTKDLGIYIHIPFCKKKCAYCDFLSWEGREHLIRRYVEALLEEIKKSAPLESHTVQTIFFGGGTPSYIEETHIQRILKTIRQKFAVSDSAEISIEINPGTVNEKKLTVYRQAGINRISMGMQSAKDEELKKLGRIHSFDQAAGTVELLKKSGFQNINIDLISGLPGQNHKTWQETLEAVIAFDIPHVSAYGLIIEEDTPFWQKYGEDARRREEGRDPLWLPTEEEERLIYELTGQLLSQNGYHRYEISNYARTGMECRHNIGYWQRRDYLGFGPGAASMLNNVRWSNTAVLEDYINRSPEKEAVQKLSIKEQIEEFLFLGLRMTDGISPQKFEAQFNIPFNQVYKNQIQKLSQQGLIAAAPNNIKLTGKGIDISNYVLSEFLLEDEYSWMKEDTSTTC